MELTQAFEDPDSLFTEKTPANDVQRGRRQAIAAISLARLGRIEAIWKALERRDDPDLRTWLTRDLTRYSVAQSTLIDRSRIETVPSIRAALAIALGGYNLQDIDEPSRSAILGLLLGWYRHDSDPGVHGAVAWLLRSRWREGTRLLEIDQALRSRDPVPPLDWFVNGQGQTFAVVRGPQRFLMGSPPSSEPPRNHQQENETDALHERRITRSFAIAATEVTVAQYREFVNANKALFPKGMNYLPSVSPDEDCPIHGVNWFEAVLYCRWVSDREKIPEDQMCFPPIADMVQAFQTGSLEMKPGHLGRTGYRLPTEAEWEFSCRAGTTTSRYFGRALTLLPEYAWFAGNSGTVTSAGLENKGRTHPVGQLKPNDLGILDVYGNLREWCLDPFEPYPVGRKTVEDTEFLKPASAGDHRVARGGAFMESSESIHSAYRNAWVADQRIISTGLRVARTVP